MVTYSYDSLNRLTHVGYADGSTIDYAYDAAGNRLTQTRVNALEDLDVDGMPDAWENTQFGNVTTANATTDFDGDGLLDKDEYLRGADPKNTDTDADTVLDGVDAFPTDPAASIDSDGDGFPDAWNTGKSAADSTSQPALTLDAFPNDPAASLDTDGDGYPDNWNTNATAAQIAASSLALDAFPSNPASWADTTAPVITMLGQTPVTVTQGATYTDAGATATDNVDGDLTANITVNNSVNTSTVGTYTVTYDVTDAAGNAATQVVRTVNVVAANAISQTYNLISGWNLISFPMDLGATGLTDFLAAVPEATSVWSFVNGGWQSFIVGTPAFLNSLKLLEAGKGYWVQLPAGVTKTVTLSGSPVTVTPNLAAGSGWNLIGVTTPVTDMAGFISSTGAASVWTFTNGQWQSFVAGTPSFLNSLQGMDVGAGYYVNMAAAQTAVNHAPVAADQTITVSSASAFSGNLTATDADGDVLSYVIVSNGSQGVATLSGHAFTYTPNAGAAGSDSFTFKANDGNADSNIATVSVNLVAASVNAQAKAAMAAGDAPGAALLYKQAAVADATDGEAVIGLCLTDLAALWADASLQAVLPRFTLDQGATLPTEASIAATLVGQGSSSSSAQWVRSASQLAQGAANATLLQDPAFDSVRATASACITRLEALKTAGFVAQQVSNLGKGLQMDAPDLDILLSIMHGMRGVIDWSRAYQWDTDVNQDGVVDTDVSTFTDTTGNSFQYRFIAIDPAGVLNDPAFFSVRANGLTRLAGALADFQQAASLTVNAADAFLADTARAADLNHLFQVSTASLNWRQRLQQQRNSAQNISTALSASGFTRSNTLPDGTQAPGTIQAHLAFTHPLDRSLFPTFRYDVAPDPVLSKQANGSVAALNAFGGHIPSILIANKDYPDSTLGGMLTGSSDLSVQDTLARPQSSLLIRDAAGQPVSGFGTLATDGVNAYWLTQDYSNASVTTMAYPLDLTTGRAGAPVTLTPPSLSAATSGPVFLNTFSATLAGGSLRMPASWWDSASSSQINGMASFDPATGANTGLVEWLGLPAQSYVNGVASNGVTDFIAVMNWQAGAFSLDIYQAPVALQGQSTATLFTTLSTSSYPLLAGMDAAGNIYLHDFSRAAIVRISPQGQVASAPFDTFQLNSFLMTIGGGKVFTLPVTGKLIIYALPPATAFKP